MAPELARLGHVALETPDLAKSMEFFHDAVGLEEVERSDDTVYLRATEEFDHHSLSLTESDSTGIDHIAWQTQKPEGVQKQADILEDLGIDVTWVEAGEELGQGEAIRFQVPNGHKFEVYHEMEKPDTPEERKSRLRNRTYSPTTTNPIAPNHLDHVQVWDEDSLECAEWLMEHMDFELHERYNEKDGSRWGTWLSASGSRIELAIVTADDPNDAPALHHTTYTVNDADDLFEAGDHMMEYQFPVEGPGQHSISRGKFLYAQDTTSGHRIEFNDGGYGEVHDPNWEPIEWEETDLEDRQWLGGYDPGKAVKY